MPITDPARPTLGGPCDAGDFAKPFAATGPDLREMIAPRQRRLLTPHDTE